MTVSLVKDYAPVRPVGMLVEITATDFSIPTFTVGRVVRSSDEDNCYHAVDTLRFNPNNSDSFPFYGDEIRPFR